MANLLPEEHKKGMCTERYLRMVIVVCAGLCINTILAALLLVPTFVLIRAKEADVYKRTQTLSELARLRDNEDVSGELSRTQEEIAILQEEAGDTAFMEYLSAVLRHRFAGIVLDDISYVNREGMTPKMLLRGQARNRQQLLDFTQRIERESIFAEAEVPLSDLARQVNVPFSLSVTIAEE